MKKSLTPRTTCSLSISYFTVGMGGWVVDDRLVEKQMRQEIFRTGRYLGQQSLRRQVTIECYSNFVKGSPVESSRTKVVPTQDLIATGSSTLQAKRNAVFLYDAFFDRLPRGLTQSDFAMSNELDLAYYRYQPDQSTLLLASLIPHFQRIARPPRIFDTEPRVWGDLSQSSTVSRPLQPNVGKHAYKNALNHAYFWQTLVYKSPDDPQMAFPTPMKQIQSMEFGQRSARNELRRLEQRQTPASSPEARAKHERDINRRKQELRRIIARNEGAISWIKTASKELLKLTLVDNQTEDEGEDNIEQEYERFRRFEQSTQPLIEDDDQWNLGLIAYHNLAPCRVYSTYGPNQVKVYRRDGDCKKLRQHYSESLIRDRLFRQRLKGYQHGRDSIAMRIQRYGDEGQRKALARYHASEFIRPTFDVLPFKPKNSRERQF